MDASAPPPLLPTSSPPPPPSLPITFKTYSGGLPSLSSPTARLPPIPPSPSSSSSSSLQSVLIIVGIIAICAVASVAIFCLLRFLSIRRRRRHRRSSSSVAALPLPLFDRRSSSSAATDSTCEAPSAALSEKEKAALIESLPLFSLASSVHALPKSSPDCAVCLSPFLREDDLRLLPACRHAFHASCIEKWLLAGDTPSCPLCRASVTLHHPPLLPPAPPTETASSAAISASERSRSGSFRIEIGSVSLRRAPSSVDPGNPGARPRPPSLPPAVRTYSIDSEWDYLVEEEVEAVVAGIAMPTEKSDKPSGAGVPAAPAAAAAAAPAAPAAPAPVAQVAGSGRSSRWLRDYVDRLSSASSSLRFSGRWSNRYDSGDAAVARQPSWHWEGSARRDAAEDGAIFSFYRWLVGAY